MMLLTQGDKVENLTVLRELYSDSFSVHYLAVDKAFAHCILTQCKTPSKLVEWRDAYVMLQEQLKGRISNDILLSDSCPMGRAFWAKAVFLKTGDTAKHESLYRVTTERAGYTSFEDMIACSPAFDELSRLRFCQKFMHVLSALHKANIVHSDIKPSNILVKEDRLILQGMDWSYLSDEDAPWNGQMGYVGTNDYFSPEHLRGEVPGEASDVFSAAVVLWEMMATVHPFGSHRDSGDLKEYVLSGKNDFTTTSSFTCAFSKSEKLMEMLKRALSPDAACRPTTAEIRVELDKLVDLI